MSPRPEAPQRGEEADWLRALRAAVKRDGLRVVAQRLGRSKGALSGVLTGKYKASTARIEERVAARRQAVQAASISRRRLPGSGSACRISSRCTAAAARARRRIGPPSARPSSMASRIASSRMANPTVPASRSRSNCAS